MGSLPDKSLSRVLGVLCPEFGLRHFVETGTWRGTTTRWAAERFDRVDTIEIDAAQLDSTRQALADLGNIRFHLGDSRSALPGVIDSLQGPAVFWLDAHKGGGFFGPGDDCPVLEEIAQINRLPHEALILIDDARGFLSPPPPPFDWRHWPDLKTILDAACGPVPRVAVVFDDVIVCAPPAMRDRLRAELHRVKPKL